MPTLDELKARIQQEASQHPDRFFAVDTLRGEGFTRGQCRECGIHFWAQDPDRAVCGEPDCSGGYTFINDPPTEKTFDVVSAWNTYADFMEHRGYTPIDRYPVAARWRDDTEVVRASIYDFQPYVVSGEVEPPANPLVVPQFCFRSNDIDNVGITGRHYTGFIMVGQHAFTAPDQYDQEKYFRDMLDWVVSDDGMAIPKDELILHEDSWGGGGNLGACMEFFVRGLELFNQVYMFYELDDSEQGYRELDTKVLDMGMGLNRIVWITHGSETSYEANMEQVVEHLYDRTGVAPNKEVWRAFLPYSGYLNFDEVDDIDATWQHIADEIGVDVDTLQAEVLPAAALYAIADHTRTLLVALNDGLLPSNAGERHALRVMVRRCFDFINRYDWDLDLAELLDWHADEFGALYPELREHVEDLKRIIRHEEQKYEQMRGEAERLIDRLDNVQTEDLVELYDSKGITPDMLQQQGVDVNVPENFYKLVAERHADEKHRSDKDDGVDVTGIDKTKKLYWDDEYQREFEGAVIAVLDDCVVMDRTAFYPTSGGQEHDTGALVWDGGRAEVVDVIQEDGVILHQVQGDLPETGDAVTGRIDWDRRTKHRKHHSATHLVNAAAQHVLGSHVWQAGSHKSEQKARLDITHYETLDRDTLQRIEDEANQLVAQDVPVTKTFMARTEAEREHGFRIYQGGAVPGKRIRIVAVDDIDVEACGGTHVKATGEIGLIRIIGSTKVQDGTIRLEYVAGEVAEEHEAYRADVTDALSERITVDQPLEDLAEIFSTEIEHLPRVVDRFIEEWEERKSEIDELIAQAAPDEDTISGIRGSYDERPTDPEQLFEEWKAMEKDIETLQQALEDSLADKLKESDDTFLQSTVATDDVGMLIRIAKDVVHDLPEKAVVLQGDNAVVGARGEENDRDMSDTLSAYAEVVQGDASFAKGFKLKQ